MFDLSRQILRLVARCAYEFRRIDPSIITSVNVGSAEISDERFVDTVIEACHDHSIPADSIAVELAEAALVDSSSVQQHVQALTERGVGITLDNFGTGYSNLSSLVRLPRPAIKVDRSFVSGLPADRRSAELCRATASISVAVAATAMAVGVESFAQQQQLADAGIWLQQGHFFGAPVPLASALWLLGTHQSAATNVGAAP